MSDNTRKVKIRVYNDSNRYWRHDGDYVYADADQDNASHFYVQNDGHSYVMAHGSEGNFLYIDSGNHRLIVGDSDDYRLSAAFAFTNPIASEAHDFALLAVFNLSFLYADPNDSYRVKATLGLPDDESLITAAQNLQSRYPTAIFSGMTTD